MNAAYVAIDFETSAFRGACACAIGLARMENLRVVDTWYALIRPPSSRIYFSDIHGLTWKELKDQPAFAELWPEISAFMAGASYLIAHNAPFDRKVLAACCEANDLPMPDLPFLCTLRGARKRLKLPRYSLDIVCEHLGINLNHHHAGSDALACGLVHARLIGLGLEDRDMLPGRPRSPRASQQERKWRKHYS